MPRPDSDTSPLSTIRTALLWMLLAGSTGTLLELLLIGHSEMAAQFAPLILLGVGILVAGWTLIAPCAVTIRSLQVLMGLFVVSGLVGVFLHYKGNETFELEMTPSRAGISLVSKTLTGATPVLAPGSMSLLGCVGLAFAYRHPLLRSPHTVSEEKS